METRAPFVVVGAFVLATIFAVFGFVYWLHNTGGLGPRATYHVQFDGSVPGLLIGAGVLFNGIRVGEVTDLGLAPDNPRRVNATISVASTTPVRSDTVGWSSRPDRRARHCTGRRHAAGEFWSGADVDCRSRRGPEHVPGCPRRVAKGGFRVD
jgi:phospholipid/cholesterol/gamma-HCH transport system substrate-binding protein